MASRVGSITQFAPLAPPWQLSQLDQNFTNETAAINDSSLGFVNGIATDTGTANNYIVALPFGTPSSYNQGMTVAFVAANTNTGASTLTVSPLGSIAILDFLGNALRPGVIQVGAMVFVTFVASAFRIQSAQLPSVFLSQTAVSTGGTTTTINCAGYERINIVFDSTAAGGSAVSTLLLQNLYWGSHIDLYWAATGSNQNLKFSASCTDQAGNSITTISLLTSGGSQFSLISAGFGPATSALYANGSVFRDNTSGGTSIFFLYGFH